jgi:hypothetical protein
MIEPRNRAVNCDFQVELHERNNGMNNKPAVK